jgi:hypothetical protein
MRYLLFLVFAFSTTVLQAQNPAPAKVQKVAVIIKNATIHTATGNVITKGTIVFEKGKITYVGTEDKTIADAKVIDATGKHVYPGFIAPNNYLGLNEIEEVRSTLDYTEVGDINPNVRSLIAYNTDSKIIPTIRVNGVLLSQCTPQGGIVSGSSSIVQLDAWNWEDAAYKIDDGIHFNYPNFAPPTGSTDAVKQALENEKKHFQLIEKLMQDAYAYSLETTHAVQNGKLESMRGVFDKSKIIYVHVDYVKGIIHAVNFFKKYNVKMVLVGAADCYQVTQLLHDNNIAVILNNTHRLPSRGQEAVDMPYKTAAILQQAGVKYCLATTGGWQIRNLPFMAGTTAGYGISKEQALESITKNTAEILGIDKTTGTLEVGKDATLFISNGDALDMQGNILTYAFIQGREISLDNSQKQLNKKYAEKYEVKIEN